MYPLNFWPPDRLCHFLMKMAFLIDDQQPYSSIINKFVINLRGEHSCNNILKSKTYAKIPVHITSTNESENRDVAKWMSVKTTHDSHSL